MTAPAPQNEPPAAADEVGDDDTLKTLKYHLLGPSLTKAGQDKVDQSKVSEVIYNASKGSKYFNREEVRDKVLTEKIENILRRKRELEKQDLTRDLRNADRLITELDATRDLTQHIVHIDCDAFYAAVEQLERPELKDLPFAVGGGVLTTCNYVARQYGCRSGMAGFVAKKLCPDLVMLKLNFQKYTAKAHEVREVLAAYDPRFESASIDEAYLNMTQYCEDHDMSPADAVEQMRREVHQRTQITVSAGIAPNAKLAKICSNMNKPNGQYLLPSNRTSVMAFMRNLPTRKVNGIGRVLERELLEIGVKTCGDLHDQRQYLQRLFGDKTFEFLIHCYLGLGRTRIQPAEEYERKSVGTESTFHEMSDPVKLREKLRWIAEELEKDMRRAQCKGRTLCLKIKLHTYEVLTRQVTTPRAVDAADDLYIYALPILARLEQDLPGMRLRLMGLRCTHLVGTRRPDTMSFFGLRPRRAGDDQASGVVKRKRSALGSDDEGEWEKIPEELLFSEDAHLSADTPAASPRRHGKEILPNPKPRSAAGDNNDDDVNCEDEDTRAGSAAQDEWWDCPICSRPQTADERLFNEHIDACLSRKTIREVVQTENLESPEPDRRRGTPPEGKRVKAGDKKRGRPRVMDPRQRRLQFGSS